MPLLTTMMDDHHSRYSLQPQALWTLGLADCTSKVCVERGVHTGKFLEIWLWDAVGHG